MVSLIVVFLAAVPLVWWYSRPHPVIGYWESEHIDAAFYKDGAARFYLLKGSWRPNGRNAVIIEGKFNGTPLIGDFILHKQNGTWTGTARGLPFANPTLKKVKVQ